MRILLYCAHSLSLSINFLFNSFWLSNIFIHLNKLSIFKYQNIHIHRYISSLNVLNGLKLILEVDDLCQRASPDDLAMRYGED